MQALAARIALLPPNLRGIFLMVLSASSYAVMLAIIRTLSHDIHFTEVVFFRVGFGLVVMLPMFVKGGVRSMRTTQMPRYIYRAALQAAAMGCYYGGLAVLPLAAGVALGQTTAIFLAVIAIWFLGEPSVLGRWIGVALGLGGALVIIDPSFAGVEWGALFVLLSSLIYGVYQVDAKVLSRTEPVTLIVFWTMAMATPMALAAAAFFWTWPSWPQLALLFVMGLTGTLGNWFMTQAYKIGEMTALAPAAYTQLVWAALIAFVLFGEIPETHVWIGSAMIVAAGILLSRLEAKRAKAG